MPSKSHHLATAEKNEKISQAIANLAVTESVTDWEITMLFYSALHFVDAFLDHSRDIHPDTHKHRKHLISTVTQLRPISKQYMDLYERSLDARYRLVRMTPEQVSKINQDKFQPIKTHIRSLLNRT